MRPQGLCFKLGDKWVGEGWTGGFGKWTPPKGLKGKGDWIKRGVSRTAIAGILLKQEVPLGGDRIVSWVGAAVGLRSTLWFFLLGVWGLP